MTFLDYLKQIQKWQNIHQKGWFCWLLSYTLFSEYKGDSKSSHWIGSLWQKYAKGIHMQKTKNIIVVTKVAKVLTFSLFV